MLGESSEVMLSSSKPEDATLKGDFLFEVQVIVIGGSQTILEVRFLGMFLALSKRLLQGCISMNMFESMRQLVDLHKVEVSK
jgi:hypothetical protein